MKRNLFAYAMAVGISFAWGGPNVERPPFVFAENGVFGNPWGAGHAYSPEKLFWEYLPSLQSSSLNEMLLSSQGVESNGRRPIMSLVSWGYEYTAATGGNGAGIEDKSQSPGWKQWGEWVTKNWDKYVALDWEGNVYYSGAGYITPLMPLDPEDWPQGIDSATYGDWAGDRLGRLAAKIGCDGFFAADFWVGLYGGNHDFHPRVLTDFESWAKVELNGSNVKEMADDIKANHWPTMLDYRAHRFARFYASAANAIRAGGREPLVGGQILPDVASTRGSGNDFRIYLEYLPAENWFFQVELQSDMGRPIPPYWTSSVYMGTHASREPDFRLGSHMDADMNDYWDAVKNAGFSREKAMLYLKHHWLSVGLVHVANRDGSVRRSTYSFQRGYWDAGSVDTSWLNIIYNHIPTNSFGPAVYYSTDLERQSESTGNPNFYYWVAPKTITWMHKGIPAGYYVADVALSKLSEINKPTGWLVYVDNLDQTKLSVQEKERLEAIAPIIDETNFRNNTPIWFEGDSLGGFSFVDQNGSVIVVVSNSADTMVQGAMHLQKVVAGSYLVKDLLANSNTNVVITETGATVPLQIAARETMVLEIPGLCMVNRPCAPVANLPKNFLKRENYPFKRNYDLSGRRFF